MLGRYSANGESITYYFYFFETEYNKLVLVGGQRKSGHSELKEKTWWFKLGQSI